MGSTFSQYKTPAFVNLDFTPTFTGHLLRKDFELGLDAAGQLKVPVPVSSLVHEIIVKLIDAGLGDGDFAALLELEARAANLDRKSTRLNSSHPSISYAVFCLKKKTHKILPTLA